MKKTLKEFLRRGLLFSNGGPIIYSVIILILELCKVEINLTAIDVFKAVISTSLMAFLIAGVSVVWQIEKLGLGFSVLIHGTSLYICYIGTYLLNNWLAFDFKSIEIFSLVFIGSYVLIWIFIFLMEKKRANKLNQTLLNQK